MAAENQADGKILATTESKADGKILAARENQLDDRILTGVEVYRKAGGTGKAGGLLTVKAWRNLQLLTSPWSR